MDTYATKSQLSSYATTSQLSNYVSSSALSSTLASYATKSYVDSKSGPIILYCGDLYISTSSTEYSINFNQTLSDVDSYYFLIHAEHEYNPSDTNISTRTLIMPTTHTQSIIISGSSGSDGKVNAISISANSLNVKTVFGMKTPAKLLILAIPKT